MFQNFYLCKLNFYTIFIMINDLYNLSVLSMLHDSYLLYPISFIFLTKGNPNFPSTWSFLNICSNSTKALISFCLAHVQNYVREFYQCTPCPLTYFVQTNIWLGGTAKTSISKTHQAIIITIFLSFLFFISPCFQPTKLGPFLNDSIIFVMSDPFHLNNQIINSTNILFFFFTACVGHYIWYCNNFFSFLKAKIGRES